MQPLPSDIHEDDVWQWLNNGWFFYRTLDGLVPASLGSGRHDQLMAVTVSGNSFEFDVESAYPHWPTCGAINLQGYAVIVQRSSTRQYRRTYNSRGVTLEIPRKWDVLRRYPEALTLLPNDPKVVSALFNPQYYTYQRALELLGPQWVSVALSPLLVLVGTPEEHLVYYRGKLLGRIRDGMLDALNPQSPRNRRVLKYFDGGVQYVHRNQ